MERFSQCAPTMGVSRGWGRWCLMGYVTRVDPDEQPASTSRLADTYQRYKTDLIRFAAVLVGPDDAGDVVSSAVVRVLIKDLDSIRNPKAYLFRAVANEARNLKRGEARRREREASASSRLDEVQMSDPYPEVRAAVERLSVRQRAVVYLAYWEDLTIQSIAEHLGISGGSVRRHLARARRNLKGVLHERN